MIAGLEWNVPPGKGLEHAGVLFPTFGMSTLYGASVEIPYYWVLAPNYDFTFSPRASFIAPVWFVPSQRLPPVSSPNAVISW